MRFPLTWLEEFIKVGAHPQKIGETLTGLGLEVDAIETQSPGFKKVVVGEVKHVVPHPDAEKLCVATVSDGTEEFQVVCGDPSCRAGLKTAFAKVGATLPDGDDKTFKIKKAKLRGVESYGMLCSAKELKISDDASSIMNLADHLTPGQDLSTLYGDVIFEISLTPNLAHCHNVTGIARELAAATGKIVKFPVIEVIEEANNLIENDVKVTVQDPVKCPRYACRLIRDVKVGPSPDWLQKKLIACDIRPINNIVDITNFVLLEMGQPLHAFDFDKVSNGEIVVRRARDKELFVTLDDKERTLSDDDLLICDGEKPVAVAGVMGGQNSEVSETTQHILLESAYFEPTTVRKTSKRLGLMTDASKRFERGCDPNQVIQALDRAAMLIKQLVGGRVDKGVVDTATETFEKKIITLRLDRTNLILGTQLSMGEVEDVFKRLDFPFQSDGKNTLDVTVATYRVDIGREIDLIEEVARIYGFDNIPRRPAKYRASTQQDTPLYQFENQVRLRLIAEGLQEFLTCDLIGPTLENIIDDQLIPQKSIIRVLNPTSIEQSTLRTSLLPGLLQVVKHNLDYQNHDVSGFEMGKVHFREEDTYKENTVFGVILSGKTTPHHWDPKPRDIDFYDLKGIVENTLKEMQIGEVTFKNNKLPTFHTGRQATIYYGSIEIGSLGEIHPTIQRKLDSQQRIFFAEVDLFAMAKACKPLRQMQDIPAYPCSERDWTITLQENVTAGEVLETIRSVPSRLLEKVYLLDIYRSEKLGKDKKNVTFHFIYRDKKKTVSQETVDAEHARIEQEVTKRMPNMGG